MAPGATPGEVSVPIVLGAEFLKRREQIFAIDWKVRVDSPRLRLLNPGSLHGFRGRGFTAIEQGVEGPFVRRVQLASGTISMRLAPLPGQNPVAPFTLVASVSATPTRNDCRGSSPCGTFKRNKAAKWARVWGDRGAHPWYTYWGANNCTNFISGALYTSHNPKYYGRGGGNMMMSNEYARADKAGTWYYRRLRSGGYSDANNWRLANLLPRYLYKYKLANKISGDPAVWRRGDLLLYQNYNKYNDYPSGKGVYYHLQMVTNVNKHGVPLLGQDAGTHYGEKNWKKIVALNNQNWGQYKTGDRGNSHKKGWGYHVLRPVHRGINVGSSNVRTDGIGD